MFTRSLLSSKAACSGGHSCPNILEMDSGDFAVIGSDITEGAVGFLPPNAGCSPTERIVRIPRQVLIEASRNVVSG